MARPKKKDAAACESKVKEVAKKKTPVKRNAKKAVVKKETAPENNKIKIFPEERINRESGAYLIIDYPVENDVVHSSGHYAIRIGASQNGYVELSFNGGEWIPCRYNDGYWWFDWVYFSAGDYVISARMVGPEGSSVIETAPRKCKVL
jgi:hypothetical protein